MALNISQGYQLLTIGLACRGIRFGMAYNLQSHND